MQVMVCQTPNKNNIRHESGFELFDWLSYSDVITLLQEHKMERRSSEEFEINYLYFNAVLMLEVILFKN